MVKIFIQESKTHWMIFKETLGDIFHVRTVPDMILTFVASLIGGIFGFFQFIIIENEQAFTGMLSVLFLDWIAGMSLALKNNDFQTRKAIKIVYYVAGYGLVLATVLSIEKGFMYAEWMVEAVMLPIITFTIIGSLKKLSILGILPKGVFLKITENIDNYDKLKADKPDNQIPVEEKPE
jgi:hypothetical protein